MYPCESGGCLGRRTTAMTPIRSAPLALLQAIPGIGLVHDYERFADKPAKFKELYQASPDSPILGDLAVPSAWL